MMYEVVKRRFQRGLRETDLPDLMVVDGGKGATAGGAHGAGGPRGDGCGGGGHGQDAGSPRRRAEPKSNGRRSGSSCPIAATRWCCGRNSNALFLLQRIRDEAHRFAITYHRSVRKRETLRSGLDGIPGVGPSRRKALLRRFGSMKRLRDASLEELLEVPSMSRPVAERIIESFHAAE